MILLALLASIIKVFLPDTKICPILAAIVLTTWIGLNYTNIDRIVAENQVARYNKSITTEAESSSDRQEEEIRLIDIFSDQYWSPDYYPALDKLENTFDRTTALRILKARGKTETDGQNRQDPPLYDWSLSYLQTAEK